MALIGTIRRNSWLLIVLLGLALAAFIIMDMSSAGNRGGVATPTLGEVEGKAIDWNDFQTADNMLNSGSTADVFGRRDQLWNYFVEEAIVSKQADALGLNIGKDELIDLQFGSNPSPVIIDRFRNPQTGVVDYNQLNQIRQQIQNNQMTPELRRFWQHQEKEIVKARLESKINTMVSKALYTPTWMVEQTYGDQTQQIAFNFVRIPFDEVEDSEVSLSNADYASYLAANKGLYMQDEETRKVEYVVFDVFPTAADSASIRKESADLIADFREAINDTTFVENNYGTMLSQWLDAESIPEAARDAVATTPVGEVYGPYIDGRTYSIVKVLDRKVMADSATSRHILINAADPASFIAAEKTVDSLKNLIETGQESFDSLVVKFSQDVASVPNGGKYENAPVNQMVPAFNDAIFLGDLGKLQVVRTQFGVHLVEPLSRSRETTERVRLAFISKSIVPSEETQNSVFEKANAFVAKNRSLSALNQTVAESGELSIETSASLKKNDFTVGNLGSGSDARDIVRWAFEPTTDLGEVSPAVYDFKDQLDYFTNKYVVAGLRSIQKAGMPDVENIKDEIELLVRNQKKGELLKSKITGTDLNAIAEQFDIEVDSAKDVTFNSTFTPGLGNEPEVIAAAFNMAVNGTSKPIVGNNGVYVLKLTNKPAVGTAFNIPQLRKTTSSSAQAQISSRLMQAMKKNADIEDNRSTFY